MKAIQEELLQTDMKTPSPQEVEAAGHHGGWTKATLASWGVLWPPPKGWRRELIRRWGRETYPLDPRDRIEVDGLF